MKYILVKWKHEIEEEPVLLYSELDDDRWEIRKVEIYSNGRKGYASKNEQFGDTGLGLEPIPKLEAIAQDLEFEPKKITKEEFEEVWKERNIV
jgi:hypothetical protein